MSGILLVLTRYCYHQYFDLKIDDKTGTMNHYSRPLLPVINLLRMRPSLVGLFRDEGHN